tara:strand:- start:839 stop:1405 length:567 start_codon:yes stop_codon:yes gene_type:complete
MVICRYIIIILSLISYTYSSSVFADFNKLKNIKITSMDFLLSKFDNFFIKNQHRILRRNPLMIYYESLNYNVVYKEGKNIVINIEAKMNRMRYKQKKYFPKLSDCNIVRNKIFYNKSGYTFFKRKKNYVLDKEIMTEILKNSIYNLENLDDEFKNFLIRQTKIKVKIIHPNQNKNYSCSGNIADIELR